MAEDTEPRVDGREGSEPREPGSDALLLLGLLLALKKFRGDLRDPDE